MRPSPSQSRLIDHCGDLAIEVVSAKAEAEWVVASALLTDPRRMDEARRLGLRRRHFADEDLNMLVAIVNEVRDTHRALRLFSTWLEMMGWKSVKPDGDWTAGRWWPARLVDFAFSKPPEPSLGEWVERLISRTRALDRALRAEAAMFRALRGAKCNPIMGPVRDAVWIQKASMASGLGVDRLAQHVMEKREGIDPNKLPRKPWRGIPRGAFAGGDKDRVQRSAERKTA